MRTDAYKAIAAEILAGTTIEFVGRHRSTFDDPEKYPEITPSVFIDMSEVEYEDWNAGTQRGTVQYSFYVAVSNYAQDWRSIQGDSRNIDDALEDWEVVDSVRELLHGLSGDGFKRIEITQEEEFLNDSALIVFRLQGNGIICN